MCLAVPGQVIACQGDDATVELQGNTLQVSKILTPAAGPGDWVLVHAGFAITQISADEARETWDSLRQANLVPGDEPLGDPAAGASS
jgi:hydrogenase expression/formation protein HypC